jgi:chromosomal replication initiator protein DnaA
MLGRRSKKQAEDAAAKPGDMSLGDALVSDSLITQQQLTDAVAAQKETGGFIGHALVELGYIDQALLTSFLVKRCKIPHISLLDYDINQELLEHIPKEACQEHMLLPIDKLGKILTVAMVDPLDTDALQVVRESCPDLKIKPILCDYDHFVEVGQSLFEDNKEKSSSVTAKALGLAERKAPAKKKAAVKKKPAAKMQTEAAMDSAVDKVIQEAAAAPAKIAAPVSVPAVDGEALAASVGDSVRGAMDSFMGAFLQEWRDQAEADTSAPAPPTVEDLSAAIQQGVADAMTPALESLSQDLRGALASAAASEGGAPVALPDPIDVDALGAAVERSVRAAMEPALAQLGEFLQPAPAPDSQALVGALQQSIAEAMAPVVSAISERSPVEQPIPATPAGPSPEQLIAAIESGVNQAMQPGLSAIRDAIETSNQAATPVTSSEGGPSAAELGAAIEKSVNLAMQPAVAAIREVAEHAQSASPAPHPALDIEALAAAVEKSVNLAMQPAVGAIREAVEASAGKIPAPLDVDALGGMLQATMREALQEGLAPLAANLADADQSDTAGLQEAHAAIAAQTAQSAETAASVREAVAAMQQALQTSTAAHATADAGDANQTADAIREAIQSMQLAFREAQQNGGNAQGEQMTTLSTAAAQAAQAAQSAVEAAQAVRAVQESEAEQRLMETQARRERLQSVRSFGEASADSAERAEDDAKLQAALTAENPLLGYTFDRFIVSEANAFICKAGQSIAARPGQEVNPLFVFGDVGIGKTHFINAIGNMAVHKKKDVRVGYVSAGRFARRVLDAAEANELDSFREHYCHWDVLILDDIQFLGGNVQAQEEFFHIFNALHTEQRQIILAADQAPDRLGNLEGRLVSRFAGGIVAQLEAPDFTARMAILQRMVNEAKLKMAEDILSVIATRVPGDVRKMTGSLQKVVAFANLADRKLSADLAYEVLNHLGITEAA